MTGSSHLARTGPAVNGPERRGGQGDEELRMTNHIGADALPAAEPGGHQLPGVGLIETRTGRADGGSTVLTRDQDAAFSQFAGGWVQDDPAQPDGL
jgi:hypothetical protein